MLRSKLRLYIKLVLLQALFIATQSLAFNYDLPNYDDQSGWHPELSENGISIFSRAWPGSDFIAVKTEQVIDSSLNNIVANLLDIESFPEWVKDMQSASLVHDFNSLNQRVIYMHMAMPWPLEDRDVVIQQTLTQDPDSYIVRITETKLDNVVPIQTGVVRIPRVQSEFILIPLREGGVRVIWQGHNEPGGLIPSFLVNWMIENIFYDSSLVMRQRFESKDFFKHTLKIQDPE